jgi:hypothetical protein
VIAVSGDLWENWPDLQKIGGKDESGLNSGLSERSTPAANLVGTVWEIDLNLFPRSSVPKTLVRKSNLLFAAAPGM